MSSTNKTLTIELSQYISTDKPTYLVDYNGDMLKIDNAFAEDRDSITTAQNSADGAGRKADVNKESIDTLNAQINGNPEDPGDTGLAGKVTDLAGDVDTIESLIGNGTPTTSNQTIIGAINGLEGAIAPREDGADLANSYAIGEQFARGGSVYTALAPLTAGTAFASLTLNTDYKNSDTLVEQIENANTAASEAATKVNNIRTIFDVQKSTDDIVHVTADGTKTYAELLAELHTAVNTYLSGLSDGQKIIIGSLVLGNVGVYLSYHQIADNAHSIGTLNFTSIQPQGNLTVNRVRFASSGCAYVHSNIASSTPTYTDDSSSVPATDTKISFGGIKNF